MVEIITDESILTQRADEIDTKKDNKVMREAIVSMKEKIRNDKLLSLSANQIGKNIRVFVINFNGELRSFVNPIITHAEGIELFRETCESIPGKTFIVPRPNVVEVMYFTPLGKIESKKFLGKAAMVFQQNVDLLNGLLISDWGLEIEEDFDNATDEEKEEIIRIYLDSLDVKRKAVEKEIEENEDLKKLSDAIDFMTSVQKGETIIDTSVNTSKNGDIKK